MTAVEGRACGAKRGTYAGVAKHRLRKEAACAPCRKAAAEYKAQWREQDSDAVEHERWLIDTRRRALDELARRHPDELRTLTQIERQP